jgi:amino acid transporter
MKAAFASVAFLVAMLLVILLGAGENSGNLFLVALVATAGLSIAFALIALGGVVMSRKDDDGWRPITALIALVILGGFALAISAILIAFDKAMG